MSATAFFFNDVSAEATCEKVLTMQGMRRRRRRSGGGSTHKITGVADVVRNGADVQTIIERLEAGNSLHGRRQRRAATAFVQAVARRRALQKKEAASQFVVRKLG